MQVHLSQATEQVRWLEGQLNLHIVRARERRAEIERQLEAMRRRAIFLGDILSTSGSSVAIPWSWAADQAETRPIARCRPLPLQPCGLCHRRHSGNVQVEPVNFEEEVCHPKFYLWPSYY